MNESSLKKLSIEDARSLCEQYQHLCGSSLIIYDHIELVKEVVPAPFNAQDQWVFFNCYHQTKDVNTALSFYKLDTFDVIVLLNKCYPDGLVEYHYMTLRNYLKRNEMVDKVSDIATDIEFLVPNAPSNRTPASS